MITALTRPKKGLYIVGTESFLKVSYSFIYLTSCIADGVNSLFLQLNKEWEALLQYAFRKSAIVECNDTQQYSNYVKAIISSPPAASPQPVDNDSACASFISVASDPRQLKLCNKTLCSTSSTELRPRSKSLSCILPFYACSNDSNEKQASQSNGANVEPMELFESLMSSTPLIISTASASSHDNMSITSMETSSGNDGGSSGFDEYKNDDDEEEEAGFGAYDHERMPSWPDSQQVERPQLINYDEIDHTKCFSPPPCVQDEVGRKSRKAHANDEEIRLLRNVFAVNSSSTVTIPTKLHSLTKKRNGLKSLRAAILKNAK